MKKIVFTLVLFAFAQLSYGQLKVYSSGKSVFGDFGSVSAPDGQIHIIRSQNEASQAIYADGPANATSFTSTYSSLYLANSNGTNNNYARLNFGDGDAAAVASIASRIQNHGTNGGSLEMWTRPIGGGAIQRRLAIQNNGNVMIGSGSATALLTVNGSANKPGGGTWLVYSDQALQKDIEPYRDGLEQIMQIDPVKFKYNGMAGIKDTESEFVGISAQEMQKIAPYTVQEVLIDVRENESVKGEENSNSRSISNESYLEFDPNALTYMLINAVKEQQQLIDEKDELMIALEDRLSKLEEALSSGYTTVDGNRSEVTLKAHDLADLRQNVPNPFIGQTRIDYVIPSNASSAHIHIYDVNGQKMKTIDIDHVGEGLLLVNVEDLPTGTYSYQLEVDGRKVQSKKMVLAR